MRRQIERFQQFAPSVLCWEIVEPGAREIDVPVYLVGQPFDALEHTPLRWWRRFLRARTGNLHGTMGRERQRLLTLMQELQPDVLLCHFGVTALRLLPIAQACGIPLVAHFHGVDLSKWLRNRYYQWSLQHSLHDFDASIVVGTHQQALLRDMGADPQRVIVIPCGAPAHEVPPKERYTSSLCRFVSVSRLVVHKGLDVTLRAFALAHAAASRTHLDLIGSGPMEPALRQLVGELHLEDAVTFHGERSAEEVRALLLASDVLVQHSLDHENGWIEGFGVSIAEASACGLPVIVTNAGGILDQVQDGHNGLVTPQHNVAAMAERMTRLAADAALRERLGRAGRERVLDHFDAGDLTRELEQQLLMLVAPERLRDSTARAV